MEKEEEANGFESVKVAGVFMSSLPEGSSPVVFLESSKEKVLPIYIGAAEAFSIQTAIEQRPYPRPLTHDLVLTILEGLDTNIEKVMIDDLSDGIFFARLIIKRSEETFEFDARPSDSIALAVRCKAPVYVSRDVMDKASVERDEYYTEGEEK